MKLKGAWSADASYNIDDIVVYEGEVFFLYKPQLSGATPKNTLCWNKLMQPLSDCVLLIMDAFEMTQDALDNFFVNEQTLLLKAGEGASEKTYAITVDATGDTPDLAVAEVTEGE